MFFFFFFSITVKIFVLCALFFLVSCHTRTLSFPNNCKSKTVFFNFYNLIFFNRKKTFLSDCRLMNTFISNNNVRVNTFSFFKFYSIYFRFVYVSLAKQIVKYHILIYIIDYRVLSIKKILRQLIIYNVINIY